MIAVQDNIKKSRPCLPSGGPGQTYAGSVEISVGENTLSR